MMVKKEFNNNSNNDNNNNNNVITVRLLKQHYNAHQECNIQTALNIQQCDNNSNNIFYV
jgi:hypothetical protein